MIETLTLGGGCFWCIQSAFSAIRGVIFAQSGYAGGTLVNPGYQQVCSGATGHAEVVQVSFDNDQVSAATLLEVFFGLHDPTCLNRQGADVGTQYRSVIFYHNQAQKEAAERIMLELSEQGIWEGEIVTELLPAPEFYPAEDYHQDYFAQHPDQPYCAAVVSPKLAKFRARHRALLK